MIACIVLVFSCIQMIGYVLGSMSLRGVGSAFYISPLPKVFSDVDGLETFASTFFIRFKNSENKLVVLKIDPDLYSKIKGPYKRRNVYGGALSYAPRLPDKLWKPVFCYGFNGPLVEEMELPEEAKTSQILIQTKTRGRNDSWILEGECY